MDRSSEIYFEEVQFICETQQITTSSATLHDVASTPMGRRPLPRPPQRARTESDIPQEPSNPSSPPSVISRKPLPPTPLPRALNRSSTAPAEEIQTQRRPMGRASLPVNIPTLAEIAAAEITSSASKPTQETPTFNNAPSEDDTTSSQSSSDEATNEKGVPLSFSSPEVCTFATPQSSESIPASSAHHSPLPSQRHAEFTLPLPKRNAQSLPLTISIPNPTSKPISSSITTTSPKHRPLPVPCVPAKPQWLGNSPSPTEGGIFELDISNSTHNNNNDNPQSHQASSSDTSDEQSIVKSTQCQVTDPEEHIPTPRPGLHQRLSTSASEPTSSTKLATPEWRVSVQDLIAKVHGASEAVANNERTIHRTHKRQLSAGSLNGKKISHETRNFGASPTYSEATVMAPPSPSQRPAQTSASPKGGWRKTVMTPQGVSNQPNKAARADHTAINVRAIAEAAAVAAATRSPRGSLPTTPDTHEKQGPSAERNASKISATDSMVEMPQRKRSITYSEASAIGLAPSGTTQIVPSNVPNKHNSHAHAGTPSTKPLPKHASAHAVASLRVVRKSRRAIPTKSLPPVPKAAMGPRSLTEGAKYHSDLVPAKPSSFAKNTQSPHESPSPETTTATSWSPAADAQFKAVLSRLLVDDAFAKKLFSIMHNEEQSVKEVRPKKERRDSAPQIEPEIDPCEAKLLAKWPSKPPPNRDWSHNREPLDGVEGKENALKMIDREVLLGGYHIEWGCNSWPASYTASSANSGPVEGDTMREKYEIDGQDDDQCFYKDYFAGKKHVNYLGIDEALGPVIISIDASDRKGHKERKFKAIVRTKLGTMRAVIVANSHKEALKTLMRHSAGAEGSASLVQPAVGLPPLAGIRFWKHKHAGVTAIDTTASSDRPPTEGVELSGLEKELIKYEQQSIVQKYKFGILYVRDGQTDEDDMFGNTEPDSPDFTEFLNCLGSKITLLGWDKFRGGLDTKTNTTGEHSYYAAYRGIEVMFHVSTLLPLQMDDKQKVERKRHLGNDVTVVIFMEGNSVPFCPTVLRSHFNRTYLSVVFHKQGVDKESTKAAGKTHYRVAIANRGGVKPYPPFLPEPAIIPAENGGDHVAVINSERAAMLAPDFKTKMIRTRATLLQEMCTSYPKEKKSLGRMLFKNVSGQKPVL